MSDVPGQLSQASTRKLRTIYILVAISVVLVTAGGAFAFLAEPTVSMLLTISSWVLGLISIVKWLALKPTLEIELRDQAPPDAGGRLVIRDPRGEAGPPSRENPAMTEAENLRNVLRRFRTVVGAVSRAADLDPAVCRVNIRKVGPGGAELLAAYSLADCFAEVDELLEVPGHG